MPSGTYLWQIDHLNPTTSSFKVPSGFSSSLLNGVQVTGASTKSGLLKIDYPIALQQIKTKNTNNIIS